MALINGDFNMAIRLSGLGGSGGLPKLAPDLTWPTDVVANQGYKSLSLTLTAGAYNTALSLTGKFSVGVINFTSLISEQVDIRLTVDGVVIWNGGQVIPSIEFTLLGDRSVAFTQNISCNSSLLLEIQTATDTVCTLIHDARPIL